MAKAVAATESTALASAKVVLDAQKVAAAVARAVATMARAALDAQKVAAAMAKVAATMVSAAQASAKVVVLVRKAAEVEQGRAPQKEDSPREVSLRADRRQVAIRVAVRVHSRHLARAPMRASIA